MMIVHQNLNQGLIIFETSPFHMCGNSFPLLVSSLHGCMNTCLATGSGGHLCVINICGIVAEWLPREVEMHVYTNRRRCRFAKTLECSILLEVIYIHIRN